jgi:hypothetical protein
LRHLLSYAICLLLPIILTSCKRQEKFDKMKWAQVSDGDVPRFPNRKYMINDLTKNHQLKGKTYEQIVEMLGDPQLKLDSTLDAFYDIDEDYGNDIDPVYTKTLRFKFDQDSIVKAFEVQVWKKTD